LLERLRKTRMGVDLDLLFSGGAYEYNRIGSSVERSSYALPPGITCSVIRFTVDCWNIDRSVAKWQPSLCTRINRFLMQMSLIKRIEQVADFKIGATEYPSSLS
jgi:hypothetical protein